MKLKVNISILSFIFTLLVFFPDQTHAVETITVEKAIELAVRENLGLKSETHLLREKQRSRDNRWNAFLPDINLSTTMSRTNQAPQNPMLEHHWNLSWRIGAQLNLSAALFDGIHFLVQDYESGLLSYKTAEKALKRDVQKSFYSLILFEQSIRLLDKNIETAEKRYRQAEINFSSGLVSELDRLQALVTLESLRPQKVELDNSYQSALLSFKQMLGLDSRVRIKLEGEINPEKYEIEVNELVFKSLSDRLDIQSLVQQIRILETDLSGSKNQRLPALILAYNKDMVFLEDPFGTPLLENREELWNDRGFFSVTLSLALDSFIPGSGTDTGIKNRQERIRSLETRLSQSLRQADIEIRTIVMRIEKSLKKIQSLEYSKMLAQRASELAEEGYNAGTVELLTFQSSDDQLQEANLKIIEERFNYITALLDLEFAVNSTMEDLYGKK